MPLVRDFRLVDHPETALAVALDCDGPAATSLIDATEEFTDIFKIGLTLWAHEGPAFVRPVVERRQVFLDLKLHDIPVQVEGAARAAASLGVSYLSVHASGGPEMVAAAVRAVEGISVETWAGPTQTAILAVTILTSLDDSDLDRIGMVDDVAKQVLRLAELALEAGAQGLVCSPREVAALRERFGPDPILLVPGIRPVGSDVDDQKRTMTPKEAAAAGADIIVVGRPITGAANPREAAAQIKELLR